MTGDFNTKPGSVPSSESTVARDEPGSLDLIWKSAASKAKKPGRKPPTPGPEKAEATAVGGSQGASPTPAAGATVKARFRSLLESAWLDGLALPTWGHKASGPDRTAPRPQLLGSQSHQL